MSLLHWSLLFTLVGVVLGAPHMDRDDALKWAVRSARLGFFLSIVNVIKEAVEAFGAAS